ncbi:NADH-dependent [FeFe] hydrogenase, group A6 [Hathewaya limosa]|uniref:NADH-quinone oxidoreductase subunit G/NADP-reducing hydrogenase subunit HndD n=1 Tax=Hathewaya limosa TaxID=1536 RepID=A0ABU0JSC3_HATLI|nr:NADH-dependent [FeFe] hydrogenase, group A6 [Hathewaya limosa]MDQ0479335.1 NADH-quinone oxidoreductase subunit G/NADP-reducing hydrogenase subunit HndD [Hathewaya limosa]
MAKINVIIDGIEVLVEENTTILEAAKQIGITIPTLCYLKGQEIKANCRICTVEIKGRNKMVTACSTPVYEGMEVLTNSKKVRELRKNILELILADHPKDCLNCIKNGNCELQKLAAQYNLRTIEFERREKYLPIDDSNPCIVRDLNKCVKCGRCVDVCKKVQEMNIINYAFRSDGYTISTPFGIPLEKTSCLYCGQCTTVCPVGALHEKEDIDRVWEAIQDPNMHVVVQAAPSIRVSLGEEFGDESGHIVTGKLVAALKRLGFDKVFDTNFAADLTIMEEGNELIYRIKNNGVIPMMTSCCPGWINYVEKLTPDVIPNISTCKSPQEMFGSIAKTYYAEKVNIEPSKIFSVSIMPCTAKKDEAQRRNIEGMDVRAVDAVLTTRELARMFRETGMDFSVLKEEKFDSPLGLGSGAGTIFGATGGVMEAALRTAYEKISNEELNKLEFNEVRGLDGIKESQVNIGDLTLNVAVVNGIKNVRNIVDQIRMGKCKYHFVEVMCCPGGCIGGGGQPFTDEEGKRERIKSLYKLDKNLPIRKSHENPDIQILYKEFLGEPLGEKSHKLLHTHYSSKKTI